MYVYVCQCVYTYTCVSVCVCVCVLLTRMSMDDLNSLLKETIENLNVLKNCENKMHSSHPLHKTFLWSILIPSH